jgi:hypothetical protein
LGNLAVTGATSTGALSSTSVTTSNVQVTGGAITNTPVSGSTGSFTTVTTGNAQVSGGAITGTPISGSTGSFTTLSATSGTITSLTSSNVAITGGTISGTPISGSTGSFTTYNGTNGSATNFSSGNVTLTGGTITGTPISGSTGSFTTLTASSNALMNGQFTANLGAESTSTGTGSIIVNGGVGVSGNVNIGRGLHVNASQSPMDTVILGQGDQSLVYVSASNDQVMFGGNTASPTFVAGAKVIFNSSDSILLPAGTSGQRPATPVAGMTRFNTTYNYMEYWNGSVWANTDTVFTLITDQQFTGDGATINFTLSAASTTNATIVSINGVVQIPGLAYSVAGSTLQFSEAPLTTDVIDVRVLVTTQSLSGMASPNGFNQIIPDDTDISFWSGTSSSIKRWKIDASTGALLPVGTGIDIGSPTAIVDNIYASNVVISGGSISGVSFTLAAIDNTVIGAATPVAGTFTTATTTSALALAGGAAVTADQTAVSFGTIATVIDSFAKATFRTAKYVISVTNGSSFQAAEVLVTHDGTNGYSSTYAVVTSGSTLATFSANVNGANVELKATGTAVGNTVKVQKTYIAV